MTNKEKFLALVSKDENNTMDYIKERIEKRSQLRESKAIAFKVLDRLEELGWSQKVLAKKMNVTPQQVNKIVKGHENLTLGTLCTLQEVLEIPLLATYHEKNTEKIISSIVLAIQEAYETYNKPLVDYSAQSVVSSMKIVYTNTSKLDNNYTETATA